MDAPERPRKLHRAELTVIIKRVEDVLALTSQAENYREPSHELKAGLLFLRALALEKLQEIRKFQEYSNSCQLILVIQNMAIEQKKKIISVKPPYIKNLKEMLIPCTSVVPGTGKTGHEKSGRVSTWDIDSKSSMSRSDSISFSFLQT